MKMFNPILITIGLWLVTLSSFAQCTSGCTTTVSTTTSTSTSTSYTIAAGQQLCITSTGVINGNITLNGGTICNSGTIQAPVFTINSGAINNYGTIIQAGNLVLNSTSVLTNYNNGVVKVSQQLLINPKAIYLAQPSAILLVKPISGAPILPAPNPPYAKLCGKLDGGYYLASDGFLYFQYDEPYTGGTLQYKVYNIGRSVVMSTSTDPLPVKAYGDNRYQLKVACKLPLGNYVLEVTNDKNEVSTLRFNVSVLMSCP